MRQDRYHQVGVSNCWQISLSPCSLIIALHETTHKATKTTTTLMAAEIVIQSGLSCKPIAEGHYSERGWGTDSRSVQATEKPFYLEPTVTPTLIAVSHFRDS
mmetsp:Transcript_31081/g.96160  ORF Transcript_31081/g.96160 Transcript_31081/m.96160 type:complete len:102 (-) Transcript_31081:678-983(-)